MICYQHLYFSGLFLQMAEMPYDVAYWQYFKTFRIRVMSPAVFSEGPYRFFFFSREEPRMHIDVHSGDGEAKF
jgi:hypothetical protein